MGSNRRRSIAVLLLSVAALGVAAVYSAPSSLANPVAVTRTPSAIGGSATPGAAPPISSEAAKLVHDFNQTPYGAITRWNGPMRIWVDSGFTRSDLQEAIELW